MWLVTNIQSRLMSWEVTVNDKKGYIINSKNNWNCSPEMKLDFFSQVTEVLISVEINEYAKWAMDTLMDGRNQIVLLADATGSLMLLAYDGLSRSILLSELTSCSGLVVDNTFGSKNSRRKIKKKLFELFRLYLEAEECDPSYSLSSLAVSRIESSEKHNAKTSTKKGSIVIYAEKNVERKGLNGYSLMRNDFCLQIYQSIVQMVCITSIQPDFLGQEDGKYLNFVKVNIEKVDENAARPQIQLHEHNANCFSKIDESPLPSVILNTMENTLSSNEDFSIRQRELIRYPKKKLLILDVNGLLVDIRVIRGINNPHKKIGGKSVFRRPFIESFLQFCFDKFEVGIWSSRKGYNLDKVVNYLMEDFKDKLLFCWDLSKCTNSGFRTLENKHKPLVLKELKKLWNKEDPDLPSEMEGYSPSNTLLVDDSPYKALLNPPHTAIFPQPYYYSDENDNCLGPGGELRKYLEEVFVAQNVQHYVEHHPFGQPAISHTSPLGFYCNIIAKFDPSHALT